MNFRSGGVGIAIRRRAFEQPNKKRTLINEQIRAQTVRLIAQDGEQLGIVPIDRALGIAAEAGLDLVEVAANSSPPVCRVMDYGRYKYMQAKKTQEARRKSAQVTLKEVKIRPKTEEHDLNVKLRKAREFLEAGNRLKVSMMFRGREMAYTARGRELLVQFAEQFGEVGQVEMMPRQEGRNMFLVMAPKAGG